MSRTVTQNGFGRQINRHVTVFFSLVSRSEEWRIMSAAARWWTIQEETTPDSEGTLQCNCRPTRTTEWLGKEGVKRSCTCDVLVRALEHAPWFAQTLPRIDPSFSLPWTRVSPANTAYNTTMAYRHQKQDLLITKSKIAA